MRLAHAHVHCKYLGDILVQALKAVQHGHTPPATPPLQQCGKLKSCETMGLHAHHPRDCLFRLRDFDVEELQDFLRENNVEFNVDPPKEQVKAARKKMRDGGGAGEVGVADGVEDEGEQRFLV